MNMKKTIVCALLAAASATSTAGACAHAIAGNNKSASPLCDAKLRKRIAIGFLILALAMDSRGTACTTRRTCHALLC